MKLTLRLKFMLWVVFQTVIVYCILIGILYAFNLHERREHVELAAEEAEEFLIVAGVTLLMMPLFFLMAWYVSRQLLRPIQRVLQSAETIAAGELDKRITTDVPNDEIGRLGKTLNEAFDKYHEVIKRLDRFSFNAAHQLRNPLGAIRASAEVCLQQRRHPEEYEEALGAIIEDSQRLAHTVEQLLLLARLGNQNLASYAAFAPFDFATFTRNISEQYSTIFEANGIELRQDIPDAQITINGNPTLLEQAVANIFDNAVRYTPPEGKVLVNIGLTNGEVLLSITDTGPGIPERIRKRLFHADLGPSELTKGSSGLGLAIAADIIRAHGGQIVAATSAEGACFTMSLPT